MNSLLYSFYHSKFLENIMKSCIYAYAFLFIVFPDLGKVFYNFFLLFSLPLLVIKSRLFCKDVVFYFLLFAITVQILSWLNSLIYFPEFSNHLPKIDRLGKLFSFIFIAFWLNGQTKSSCITLLMLVLGFILSVSLSPTLSNDIDIAISGGRVDFDLKNAQFTSMFAGVGGGIILFLLSYKKHSMFNALILLLLLFLLSSILVFSQSRQVWLSVAIVLLFLPLITALTSSKVKWRNIFINYFLVLVSFTFLANLETIQNRVLNNTLISESNVIQHLVKGDIYNVPFSGNGIRINSWVESIPWIRANIVFGSGPNAISEVIQQSTRFSEGTKKNIHHLHSFHIEILVAYGILGASVIYGLYYWLIRSLVLAHRENPELKMYTVLGICFLIFWIIINFFESFSSRSYGVYVHNIMFGCLYTFYFTQRRKKIEEAEGCA